MDLPKFMKPRNVADVFILLGMTINGVVILLILYYFVL